VTASFDKGKILKFDEAISAKLQQIADDLESNGSRHQSDLFSEARHKATRLGTLDLRKGSCLDLLPDMAASSVDLVITSPPYCNRYDYTRTYALELIYLGLDQSQVKRLRQAMLSCTVENKAKLAALQAAYSKRDRNEDFARICLAFERAAALHEALEYLDACGRSDNLNNSNIPRMVRNYFLEMAFVVFELFRVLRAGGRVVMVNDNVRYVGEELPVDLILSDFARQFGFVVEHIWTLPRGKGNSSQQMGAHGRSELRKCVYVWRKR
jgi:hypothetical protein